MGVHRLCPSKSAPDINSVCGVRICGLFGSCDLNVSSSIKICLPLHLNSYDTNRLDDRVPRHQYSTSVIVGACALGVTVVICAGARRFCL